MDWFDRIARPRSRYGEVVLKALFVEVGPPTRPPRAPRPNAKPRPLPVVHLFSHRFRINIWVTFDSPPRIAAPAQVTATNGAAAPAAAPTPVATTTSLKSTFLRDLPCLKLLISCPARSPMPPARAPIPAVIKGRGIFPSGST